MSITEKFKKDLNTLRGAANGEFNLYVKNSKLYKKLLRYYTNEGIVFSDDAIDNYDIMMELIAEDLETLEVA